MERIELVIKTAIESGKKGLNEQAKNLKYDEQMTITGYVIKPTELCTKMIRIGFDSIQKGGKTVLYTLTGIEHHPDYPQYVSPLTITLLGIAEEAKDIFLKVHQDIHSASE